MWASITMQMNEQINKRIEMKSKRSANHLLIIQTNISRNSVFFRPTLWLYFPQSFWIEKVQSFYCHGEIGCFHFSLLYFFHKHRCENMQVNYDEDDERNKQYAIELMPKLLFVANNFNFSLYCWWWCHGSSHLACKILTVFRNCVMHSISGSITCTMHWICKMLTSLSEYEFK